MDLDFQQKQAVETESTSALVLSGAGSGKTRVLIERISYLVEQKHVAPSEILAFSFTRKAAGEIRDRLETRLGPMAHGIQSGTMHGIALEYLRRFGEYIGMKPKSITVYGQFESDYLLKECAIDLGIYKIGPKKTSKWMVPKKAKPGKQTIDGMFADYYERGILPDDDHPGECAF